MRAPQKVPGTMAIELRLSKVNVHSSRSARGMSADLRPRDCGPAHHELTLHEASELSGGGPQRHVLELEPQRGVPACLQFLSYTREQRSGAVAQFGVGDAG